MAMKRDEQSQRQVPAFRGVQINGTNSRKGVRQDFISDGYAKVQAWMDYRHRRNDIPAEASIQSWPLCTRTRACEMIQETVSGLSLIHI